MVFHRLLASPNQVYGTIFIDQTTNRALLVRGRLSGKWSFPKGHAKEGETEFEAAKRETFEETGLVLDRFDRILTLATGCYYLVYCSEIPVQIQDSKEICEAKWVHIPSIRSLNANIDVNAFLNTLGPKSTKSMKPKYIVRPCIL
jgi:8-oxo-dGTP pyrophosphatase MutT (NUDIX family)